MRYESIIRSLPCGRWLILWQKKAEDGLLDKPEHIAPLSADFNLTTFYYCNQAIRNENEISGVGPTKMVFPDPENFKNFSLNIIVGNLGMPTGFPKTMTSLQTVLKPDLAAVFYNSAGEKISELTQQALEKIIK